MSLAWDPSAVLPLVVLSAYILDLVVGDPRWLPHPVRWMGRLTGLLEGVLKGLARTPFEERAAGALMSVLVVGLAYASSALVLGLAAGASPTLYLLLYLYMAWTAISIRSLGDEADAVLQCLRAGDMEGARKKLSRIVGRDTEGLSREGVLRAVVETVSENTSDGVIAPLFYLAVGGPPLAMSYKAVNTLDSMVGYRNERYRYFGWFSARLDDLANYLPARITACLMVMASMVSGSDWKGSYRVLKRDGRAFSSPNAGLPQAAAAGALGVRLGGTVCYDGVPHDKPFIGEGTRDLTPEAAAEGIRIMHITALGMTLSVVLISAAVGL